MPKKTRKRFGFIILIVIFILIIIFSYKIYRTFNDNKKTIKEVEKIKDEVIIDITPTPMPSSSISEEKPKEAPKLPLDFTKLKAINSDTVAWIKISNTDIDYPIVQTKDNKYYLNHSFYKNQNMNGWIYENYENSKQFDDDNTIIFGHNTNSNTMFSELKDIYKGILGTNINITIYLENDTINYKVFSIYLEKPNNTSNISKYTNAEMIKNMQEQSKIQFPINIDEDSKILTLSTCNNVTSDRIILHAVKIS